MKNLGSLIPKVVLSIAVVVLGYLLYLELFEPYFFTKEKEKRYAAVKERMENIIEAQEAYKNLRNVFADDFDTLAYILQTDSMMVLRTFGEESDSVLVISVDEATKLLEIEPTLSADEIFRKINLRLNAYNKQLKEQGGDAITTYQVIDTSFTPLLLTVALTEPIDSLKYIPFSGGEQFELDTDVLTVGLGRVKVPVYEVIAYNSSVLKGEKEKYFKKKEGIVLGSLLEARTDIVEIVIKDKE